MSIHLCCQLKFSLDPAFDFCCYLKESNWIYCTICESSLQLPKLLYMLCFWSLNWFFLKKPLLLFQTVGLLFCLMSAGCVSEVENFFQSKTYKVFLTFLVIPVPNKEIFVIIEHTQFHSINLGANSLQNFSVASKHFYCKFSKCFLFIDFCPLSLGKRPF